LPSPPLAEKLQSFDEEIAMGLAQRIIRKALRKLVGEISTENVAFIFTNHEIFRMQTMPFAEKTISWEVLVLSTSPLPHQAHHDKAE